MATTKHDLRARCPACKQWMIVNNVERYEDHCDWFGFCYRCGWSRALYKNEVYLLNQLLPLPKIIRR